MPSVVALVLSAVLMLAAPAGAQADSDYSRGDFHKSVASFFQQIGGDYVLVISSDSATPVRLVTFDAFVAEYGVADAGGLRDETESIIPTPSEPSPSSGWGPGDQVHYYRDAIHNGSYYTRHTVYERQMNGSWYRMSNIFRNAGSLPPGCSRVPCSNQNPK